MKIFFIGPIRCIYCKSAFETVSQYDLHVIINHKDEIGNKGSKTSEECKHCGATDPIHAMYLSMQENEE